MDRAVPTTYPIDRRTFLRRGLAGAAAIAVALDGSRLFAQGKAPAKAWQPIRRGVGVFHGRGGTIGWYLGKDGAVVVDSQFPATAELCRDELTSRLKESSDSARVRALINTHHHGDHTGGNGVFAPLADRRVAHHSVPRRQAAQAKERKIENPVLPDTTFERSWRLRLDDETVHARHYGPAHTGGDAVIHFERANVAHMGDLMFNRLHPFIDRAAGASVPGWARTINAVLEAHSADTIFICGHGHEKYGVLAKPADLRVQRDYWLAVWETAEKGIAAGKSRDEITKQQTLAAFPEHLSRSPRLSLPTNLGVAYDEIMAKNKRESR